MRIHGPNAAGTAAPSTTARRSTSAAFTLGEQEAPRAPTGTAAPRTIGGIDALMALQGYEDATERRKRAVKRGRRALDVLDELKIGMLSGKLDPGAAARLQAAAAGLTEPTGDPGLDSLMAEIELRLAVEIAKSEPRGR